MNDRTLTNLGDNHQDLFSGNCSLQANQLLYSESAPLISSAIRRKLPDKEPRYIFADFGSNKGSLLHSVLQHLPDYHFQTVAIDIPENLIDNTNANVVVAADISEYIPMADSTADIGMMRYVLSWNNFEKQPAILNEITRVMKGFIVLQHGGADDNDPDAWRRNMDIALNGSIPKIKRTGHFFASRGEIEEWMKASHIKFECILSRRIKSVSDVFIERTPLDTEESEMLRDILDDKDYIIQTTWIISK